MLETVTFDFCVFDSSKSAPIKGLSVFYFERNLHVRLSNLKEKKVKYKKIRQCYNELLIFKVVNKSLMIVKL